MYLMKGGLEDSLREVLSRYGEKREKITLSTARKVWTLDRSGPSRDSIRQYLRPAASLLSKRKNLQSFTVHRCRQLQGFRGVK
ncbi:hypothetical protein SUGI_0129210 [Cryptomeria japonica]|nr:hypothetical protein SUGI_0129210 [Cryptomeria japonica]